MPEKLLLDLVVELASNDEALSDDAQLLVLAAMEGGTALADALDGLGSAAATARGPLPRPARPLDVDVTPAGAYLTGIEVAGFRGIGPAATLSLNPGPGLTVVVGRNGCGKSSFAEALELALTGDSYRWHERAPVWSDDWRNLHVPDPCRVRIGLAVDGVGPVTIGLDWRPEHGLGERDVWSQRDGRPRERGIAGLGWDAALDTYRPLLSYEELGGRLRAKQSEMHDAVAAFLGLEPVTDAVGRLREALSRANEPERRAREQRPALLTALEASDDERAAAALLHVRSTKPDLDVLGTLAVGSAETSTAARGLSAITAMPLPDPADVARAVDDLTDVLAAAEDDAMDAVRLVEQRSTLIEQAMRLHDHQGDTACPVCGEGTLDATWRDRATAELARDRATVLAVRARRDALGHAIAAARALVSSTPALVTPGVELTAFAAAREADDCWRAMPTAASELVIHLTRETPRYTAALAELRTEAAEALARTHDSWAPIARHLVAWTESKRRIANSRAATRTLASATTWLKATEARLRTERLRPFADRSRAIWSLLRQESNVDLGDITLSGQHTRRHIALTAEVDGRPGGALGVMSQGELHALGLALFLPRATAPESPLRFVVLDDPVQAMDPSKVDGLVTLLDEIARERQVVVFSHDDRLAEAVRRMAVEAMVVQVSRGAGSVVDVRSCLDPATRHIEDAFAIAADEHLDPEIKALALPGMCRLAVESAARDVHYARRFRAGVPRDVLETEWQAARGVTQKIALALHSNPKADIGAWRKDTRSRHRDVTLTITGKGVHQGWRSDPVDAVRAVRKTVTDLLQGRR